MAKTVRQWIVGGAISFATMACASLVAGTVENEDVLALWNHYIIKVGCRDEVEVLACYQEQFRSQLTGDRTAAGRARLDVHMSDMFEILQRDWDHTIVDETSSPGKVTLTIKFRHRKEPKEHQAKVTFVDVDGRWFIEAPPEMPDFLSAGKGTITMIAGIVAALGVVAFLAKKALA